MGATNELLKQYLPLMTRALERQSINQIPEVVTGEATSSTGSFYYLMKGAGTPGVVTEIKRMDGTPYPSSLVTFINNEVSDGTYFYLPFSEVSISSGNLLIAKSDFK